MPGFFLQEAGDNNQFCWRNLFSCINLLRILNKLTKWKHSRTMVSWRSQRAHTWKSRQRATPRAVPSQGVPGAGLLRPLHPSHQTRL